MKTLTFLALTASAVAATDSAIPQPFSRERYEETRTASPFVLATKSDDKPPAEVINPFAQLYVVGLGRVDGKEYVTIVRHGEETKPIRLWGSEASEDGISVQQVVWSDKFGQSKVKLKKGSDVGEIGFDENATKSAIAGTPMPGQQANRPPGVPGGNQPQNQFRPPNAPTNVPQPNSSIPRPGGNYTPPPNVQNIPRPTGGAIPNGGANNPATQSRQRIRVVPNK